MTTVIDILKGIVSAITVSIPVEWIAWIRYNGVWAGPPVKIRVTILPYRWANAKILINIQKITR